MGNKDQASQASAQGEKEDKTNENRSQSERAISTIAFCILGGCLGIVIFALQTLSLVQFFSIFAVGLLIAGACVLSGGLLGFLFGIPRTLQHDRIENIGQNKEQPSDKDISYQVNTNLEQISDWLTKILVGVGLTQITALPEELQKYANFVSPGLGGGPASKTFAVAVLVFYSVCGFLLSYLWTRIYLAGALKQADREVVGRLASGLDKQKEKIAEVENKVSEIEKQREIDAKAYSTILGQLNPGQGPQPTTQDQEAINLAVLPASRPMKAQIYYLAQDTRSQNWRDIQTKPIMERTIPIFRALIASDTENIFHLNHGQLGFALKDQRQPNWSEACTELTTAIEIRGPWEEKGWLLYEFNRAICKINLDQAFVQGRKSSEETKNEILWDLKSASSASSVNDLILNESVIKEWLTLNNITWD